MIIGCVGDGVKIDFSVRVILFLGWSPKTHTLTRGQLYQIHSTDLKN